MQALSRSRALQPARPGRNARFEFEYERNGTRCLFSCFNIATGQVVGRCTTSRKREDFLSFLPRLTPGTTSTPQSLKKGVDLFDSRCDQHG